MACGCVTRSRLRGHSAYCLNSAEISTRDPSPLVREYFDAFVIGLDRHALQADHLKLLFVLVEEVVVGGVRHERLVTHIGGDGAAGCWGSSAGGVQALDEGGLAHAPTSRRP